MLTTMVMELQTVMTLTHVTMITTDGTIHGKIPVEQTQLIQHLHLSTQTVTVLETQVALTQAQMLQQVQTCVTA